jgi:hypothetical protein
VHPEVKIERNRRSKHCPRAGTTGQRLRGGRLGTTRPARTARDKNGELSKKHGNTLVRTLRKVYGQHFAEGCRPEEKLSDVLHKVDEPSLSKLVHDHDPGKLGDRSPRGHRDLGVPGLSRLRSWFQAGAGDFLDCSLDRQLHVARPAAWRSDHLL